MLKSLVLITALSLSAHSAFANGTIEIPDVIAEEMGVSPDETGEIAESDASLESAEAESQQAEDGARLVVRVSQLNQRATVTLDGQPVADVNGNVEWKVSTGKNEQICAKKSGRCYYAGTPDGTYAPYKRDIDYVSGTWGSLMEFAIFFKGGVAIHATTRDHESELGRTYKGPGSGFSGGCVRLQRLNAQYLWKIIHGTHGITNKGKPLTNAQIKIIIE